MSWDHVFSVWGMLIIAILCSTLYVLLECVARTWRRAYEAEIEGSLKSEMIKQGRSADEIERILRASGKSRTPTAN